MKQKGFSLVEMLVVLVIAGIALAIAVPNLQDMIISARTRSIAESIQSGLLLARSEAIKRNAMMRFQLVSTMDGTCAASAASRLWVVTQFTSATTPSNSRGQPWNLCDKNGYTPPDQEEPCPATPAYSGNATSCAADPFIAYKSATDTAASVDVAALPAATGALAGFVVTYGPMGQLLASYDGASTVAPSTTGASCDSAAAPTAAPAAIICVKPSTGVNGKRYRVLVKSNGGIRLCTPDAQPTDAMFC